MKTPFARRTLNKSKGAVTLCSLSRNISRFQHVHERALHVHDHWCYAKQYVSCNLQWSWLKNGKNTASADIWRKIVSQEPIGIHSVSKQCETSCKRMLYCMQCFENALLPCCNRCEQLLNLILLCAVLVATKMLRDSIIARYVILYLAISRATYVAATLRDMKLREKLHSV
jgi:hypothetical protein